MDKKLSKQIAIYKVFNINVLSIINKNLYKFGIYLLLKNVKCGIIKCNRLSCKILKFISYINIFKEMSYV